MSEKESGKEYDDFYLIFLVIIKVNLIYIYICYKVMSTFKILG